MMYKKIIKYVCLDQKNGRILRNCGSHPYHSFYYYNSKYNSSVCDARTCVSNKDNTHKANYLHYYKKPSNVEKITLFHRIKNINNFNPFIEIFPIYQLAYPMYDVDPKIFYLINRHYFSRGLNSKNRILKWGFKFLKISHYEFDHLCIFPTIHFRYVYLFPEI